MSFLNYLYSIIQSLFEMFFTFDRDNPFVYLSCLLIVVFITLFTFKLIFNHK